MAKSKKTKLRQKYQIDQSIKIENTNKTTYVSLTNSKAVVVSISAKDKRELKLFFRKLGKPLIFKLFTFSVLCVKVLIDSGASAVVIDLEYMGHEIDIKSFITQILLIENHKIPLIVFKKIGKSAKGHEKAHKAMKSKKSDLIVKTRDVLRYFSKIDKS